MSAESIEVGIDESPSTRELRKTPIYGKIQRAILKRSSTSIARAIQEKVDKHNLETSTAQMKGDVWKKAAMFSGMLAILLVLSNFGLAIVANNLSQRLSAIADTPGQDTPAMLKTTDGHPVGTRSLKKVFTGLQLGDGNVSLNDNQPQIDIGSFACSEVGHCRRIN